MKWGGGGVSCCSSPNVSSADNNTKAQTSSYQCPRLNCCRVFEKRSLKTGASVCTSTQALTSALSKTFLVPDRTSQATLSWLVPPPTVRDNTTAPSHPRPPTPHTRKTKHMHLAFVSEQQSKRHASVGDVNLSSVWTEISCVQQICYCCYTDTGCKNCRRLSVSYLCWQWTGQLCEWQTGWVTERHTPSDTDKLSIHTQLKCSSSTLSVHLFRTSLPSVVHQNS